MTAKSFFAVACFAGLISAVLGIAHACAQRPLRDQKDLLSNYSHNMRYVRCNKYSHPNEPVEVEIKRATGVGDFDKVIFVCVGDTIRWYTNEASFSFSVAFDDSSAGAELFDASVSKFDSHPDTSTSSNHHQQVTADFLVGKNVKFFNAYSYKPNASGPSGTTISLNDPHVIPMGK